MSSCNPKNQGFPNVELEPVPQTPIKAIYQDLWPYLRSSANFQSNRIKIEESLPVLDDFIDNLVAKF